MTEIGRIGFCTLNWPERGCMQEFHTIKIDAECVTGEYTSIPSGEVRAFSYRLDKIKNLTIHLFADGRIDKTLRALQPKNNEAQ